MQLRPEPGCAQVRLEQQLRLAPLEAAAMLLSAHYSGTAASLQHLLKVSAPVHSARRTAARGWLRCPPQLRLVRREYCACGALMLEPSTSNPLLHHACPRHMC